MEEYREGQNELHCVFVYLEKPYDRVPKEELWCCMTKLRVAEKEGLNTGKCEIEVKRECRQGGIGREE